MVSEKILKGISAGLMIAIGGCVFLACENRYVGAVLFSVALLSICCKGYYLFTGKVGFLPEKHGKEEISIVLFALLGNAIATCLFGWLWPEVPARCEPLTNFHLLSGMWASQVAQWERICMQCRRLRFDPWVGEISWRRGWQPKSNLLAWRIPWTEEPGRLQSMGCKQSDVTEVT